MIFFFIKRTVVMCDLSVQPVQYTVFTIHLCHFFVSFLILLFIFFRYYKNSNLNSHTRIFEDPEIESTPIEE